MLKSLFLTTQQEWFILKFLPNQYQKGFYIREPSLKQIQEVVKAARAS